MVVVSCGDIWDVVVSGVGNDDTRFQIANLIFTTEGVITKRNRVATDGDDNRRSKHDNTTYYNCKILVF